MKSLWMMAGLLAAVTGARAGQWELMWSDEFDYQGLPDRTKWGYEEGFVRNSESQYYTRARQENARVEDGMLIIECRKEHFKPENHDAVEYTAASLITPEQGELAIRPDRGAGKTSQRQRRVACHLDPGNEHITGRLASLR